MQFLQSCRDLLTDHALLLDKQAELCAADTDADVSGPTISQRS